MSETLELDLNKALESQNGAIKIIDDGEEEQKLQIYDEFGNIKIDPEETSLEFIVEMAKEGDIDPWDVDLELVTELYLKAIDNGPRENLREAARAIFFASVLLRLKSEVLAGKVHEALNIGMESEESFDELLAEEIENFDNIKQITFHDLELAIKRRTMQKANRFRPITLEDLISALRGAEEEEERKKAREEQLNFLDEFDDAFVIEPEISDDISELTHEEDLESSVQKVRGYLLEHLVPGQCINFVDIVGFLGSWADAFLACTFLSHENEVELKQEELYGELWLYEPESTN